MTSAPTCPFLESVHAPFRKELVTLLSGLGFVFAYIARLRPVGAVKP